MSRQQLLNEIGTLPGSVVLVAMRTYLWRMFFIVLGISVLSSSSRGTCGLPDEAGMTQCTTISLGPSPLPAVVLFFVTIWVLGALVRRASNEEQAVAFINKVSLWVLGIAAVGVVASQVFFWMTPIEGWPQPNMWFSPFPFMNLHVETSIS